MKNNLKFELVGSYKRKDFTRNQHGLLVCSERIFVLKIAEGIENLEPNINDINQDLQKTSTRVINPSNDEKENFKARKEVVRYVEIPSSFPHFPLLTELYNSNSDLGNEMLEKSHARLPITDSNQKVMRD